MEKPPTGYSILLITFSIKVDFPHPGGPVTSIFLLVIITIRPLSHQDTKGKNELYFPVNRGRFDCKK